MHNALKFHLHLNSTRVGKKICFYHKKYVVPHSVFFSWGPPDFFPRLLTLIRIVSDATDPSHKLSWVLLTFLRSSKQIFTPYAFMENIVYFIWNLLHLVAYIWPFSFHLMWMCILLFGRREIFWVNVFVHIRWYRFVCLYALDRPPHTRPSTKKKC